MDKMSTQIENQILAFLDARLRETEKKVDSIREMISQNYVHKDDFKEVRDKVEKVEAAFWKMSGIITAVAFAAEFVGRTVFSK